MSRVVLAGGLVVLTGNLAFAAVNVTFTRDGGQPLVGRGGVDVIEYQIHSAELWLTNTSPLTESLSAYEFDFAGGDFATGRLDAVNWLRDIVFDGLQPPWLSDSDPELVDQTLDTANVDYVLSDVTGSLSTPFVGPALPLGAPVLIGTFDVYIDASEGEYVDFLLGSASGIDDQDGNLAGAGIDSFGVSDVLVIPEPSTVGLLMLGGLLAARRRSPAVVRHP